MTSIPVGAITGLVLSVTTSYLITGRLFHRFQARTPGTWRAESWRRHLLAMLLYTIAGASLGWLFALAGAPAVDGALFRLCAAVWIVVAALILMQALYVNWHPGFALGLALDWAVFVTGVLLACALLVNRTSGT
jgi:hypothetical protein